VAWLGLALRVQGLEIRNLKEKGRPPNIRNIQTPEFREVGSPCILEFGKPNGAYTV
jgi:hypothetical protein